MSVHCEKCGQAKWLPDVFKKIEDQNEQLRISLTQVLQLIDDADLVRNTCNDSDIMAFMKQGQKLVEALKGAQAALKKEHK